MFALKVQCTSPRLSLLQVNKKTVRQSQRYRKLWGSIIQTIPGCGVIPSILWGGVIYFQFSASYTAKITDDMKIRAKNRRDSSDLFLNERTTQFFSLTSPATLEQLQNEDPSAESLEPCIGIFAPGRELDRNPLKRARTKGLQVQGAPVSTVKRITFVNYQN